VPRVSGASPSLYAAAYSPERSFTGFANGVGAGGERDALNAALMDAHAKGLRPFRCCGCGDWFIHAEPYRGRGGGRDRMACDDLWCLRISRYWKRYGRMPSYEARALLNRSKRDRALKPVQLLLEVAA